VDKNEWLEDGSNINREENISQTYYLLILYFNFGYFHIPKKNSHNFFSQFTEFKKD